MGPSGIKGCSPSCGRLGSGPMGERRILFGGGRFGPDVEIVHEEGREGGIPYEVVLEQKSTGERSFYRCRLTGDRVALREMSGPVFGGGYRALVFSW